MSRVSRILPLPHVVGKKYPRFFQQDLAHEAPLDGDNLQSDFDSGNDEKYEEEEEDEAPEPQD